MDRIIRVLVVDDSAYVRKVVKQMLSRSPFIEVVGAARDGAEALELVEQLKPDVVTCDLIMAGMDGTAFLREQMARSPLPVLIVSIANESGELALAALDAGAIDFVQKPTALATEKIFEVSDELIEKVKAAASVPMNRLNGVPARETPELRRHALSPGGPQALKYLIPRLPVELAVPVVVVIHMPIGYTEMYARKLNELSALSVVEAKDSQPVEPGCVLLEPAGRHLSFERDDAGKVLAHLDARPFDTPHRPSVDVLFQSA